MNLQDDLSNRIVETGAHGVVIDISALELVDSFIGRMLSTIAAVLAGSRRPDRRRGHAPGGCDHVGRTRSFVARRGDRAGCRERPGPDRLSRT